MKRVLLVHTHVIPHGGGQAVAAWAIQALKDVVDLTVLSWSPPDCEGVNRFFGTSIDARDFRSECISPALSRPADRWATPVTLLKRALLQRRCRKLDRRHRYDVLLSTDNEMDFGRRGIQYVHFPVIPEWNPGWESTSERRWYHRIPGLMHSYRGACARLGDWSEERARANLTLSNSGFIADRLRRLHGIGAATLFPPVPGGFPEVAWEARGSGFVFIGRILSVKRVLEMIDIIEGVRHRGHAVRLMICGTRDSQAYLERVQAAVDRHASWVQLHLELPRARMVEIVARQRYGILAMHDEHFGIGVAELLRAGCIPFVHDSGGCREIVGPLPLLRFGSEDDAVDKIDQVLRSTAVQADIRAALAKRKELFSEERFVREIRRAVLEFDTAREAR